jgi:hypothetical protein
VTKKVDLGGDWARKGWIWGQCGARRADHFGCCEEQGEVNLALMVRGWISAAEGGGGEVWPGWLGGWWRSLEANHIPNQQEMQREAWIVQK